MNLLSSSFLVFIVLCAMAESAYGQQPTDVVTSDLYNNTAMGTDALLNFSGGPGGNTAAGDNSLMQNTTGYRNTALGAYALTRNTVGTQNTSSGYYALFANTTGNDNTASGAEALFHNTTGYDNTAVGSLALRSTTTGYQNTACGADALNSNTDGTNNTATGFAVLYSNAYGADNTASGSYALNNNTAGSANTASGSHAMIFNVGGSQNTASGYQSLGNNVGGESNTALGFQALFGAQNGNYNTGLGFMAGSNLAFGSNNIYVGNVGMISESNKMRIGTQGTQTATYIAGIYNTSVNGIAVVVDPKGQLGVVVSSERFKTGIAPMGSDSSKLGQLRPVTFHLKTDPAGTLQYGLIAEQVAEVYPELVIRNENGRIDGVRYDELAPMLLNEVQQQQSTVKVLAEQNAAQAAEIRDLKQQQNQFATQTEVQDLKQQLQAALLRLRAQDEVAARR